VTQREREYAGAKGFEISAFAMALDGVTIVVNRANPIAALSIGQLHDIFTGKVRDWRELEAGDGEIVPFARASGSGTASLFAERVLGEQAYATSARICPPTRRSWPKWPHGREPSAIPARRLRVGGDKIRAVALAADSQSAPVTATPESVVSGGYPLSRNCISPRPELPSAPPRRSSTSAVGEWAGAVPAGRIYRGQVGGAMTSP